MTHRGMMTERRTPILFVRMTVECPYYGLHSCEAGSRDWGGGGGCTTHNVAKAVGYSGKGAGQGVQTAAAVQGEVSPLSYILNRVACCA